MRSRSHRIQRVSAAGETAARVALEVRWRDVLGYDYGLTPLVTGERNDREAFHRWFHLRQSFAPELVRLFLKQSGALGTVGRRKPYLDPFGGAGTLAIECARRNIPAVTVEVSPALAFLANARMEQEFPELPAIGEWGSWQEVADRLQAPVHRAALMLAVGKQHQANGSPLAHPPSLKAVFAQVIDLMGEDLRHPLPVQNETRVGDSRSMKEVADNSVAGLLTSPPYLSRHDYDLVLRPYQRVLDHWRPAKPQRSPTYAQLPAYVGSAVGTVPKPPEHAAVAECCVRLRANASEKLARLVAVYFADMGRVLDEWARVLGAEAPCWVVIGGARLKDVYVPSDLVFAEMAKRRGFRVERIRVARDLIGTGRKMGCLTEVGPRESLLMMRKG